MLTYADSIYLYAEYAFSFQLTNPSKLSQALDIRMQTSVLSRMLKYAHVCSRMLTYAHECSRMLTYSGRCRIGRRRRRLLRLYSGSIKVLLRLYSVSSRMLTNADVFRPLPNRPPPRRVHRFLFFLRMLGRSWIFFGVVGCCMRIKALLRLYSGSIQALFRLY